MNFIYYALISSALSYFVLFVFFMLVLTPVHRIAITGKVLTPWQRWCERTRVWVVLSMTVLFWVSMVLIVMNYTAFIWSLWCRHRAGVGAKP